MTSENIITARGLLIATTLIRMGASAALTIAKDNDTEDGGYYVLNARDAEGYRTALAIYYKREEAEEMKRYIERCVLPEIRQYCKTGSTTDQSNHDHQ